jgi:hypothetical protein
MPCGGPVGVLVWLHMQEQIRSYMESDLSLYYVGHLEGTEC